MKHHLITSLALLLSVATAVFASPASVTLQPTNQTALVGSSVSYLVDFSGTPPVQCQWYKSGVAVTSATNALLSLTNISVTASGAYYAVVSNAEGTNTSLRARLFVEMTNAVSTPLAMTGWNRDVILENTATPFAQPFDQAANIVVYDVWFEEGFNGNPNGLPQSRQFTSAISHPDVVFEFQPYNSSNALWLTAFPASQRTNTLTLVSPKPYVSLSIAAASGYGDQNPSSAPGVSGYLVLNFSDGSQSAMINLVSLDWLVTSTPPNFAFRPIAGLGSHYTTNSGASYIDGFNRIALCQTDINLLALGYAGKSLASITFVGAQSSQYFTQTTTGIFAVSGVAADLGINPPVFLQSNVTNQNVMRGANLSLTVSSTGPTPIFYQWQKLSFAAGTIADMIGQTNATLVVTNLQVPASYFVTARNPVGVATAFAEINSYFGKLTANGANYNWGWSFFRQTSVIAQRSTNLVDWENLVTFGNSLGFSLNDNKQSAQKFFRIVPQ